MSRDRRRRRVAVGPARGGVHARGGRGPPGVCGVTWLNSGGRRQAECRRHHGTHPSMVGGSPPWSGCSSGRCASALPASSASCSAGFRSWRRRARRRSRQRSCGSSARHGSRSRASSGACLAVSGAAYQGAFRNPLADPYLLGAAAGAGLGATLALVSGAAGSFAAGTPLLPLASFVGALVGVALAYCGRRVDGRAHHDRARAGRRRRGVVPHGGADVRAAAELRHAARGLHVDPRAAGDRGLERRRADPAVRGREHRRAAAARAAARRAGARRRRGREPGAPAGARSRLRSSSPRRSRRPRPSRSPG